MKITISKNDTMKEKLDSVLKNINLTKYSVIRLCTLVLLIIAISLSAYCIFYLLLEYLHSSLAYSKGDLSYIQFSKIKDLVIKNSFDVLFLFFGFIFLFKYGFKSFNIYSFTEGEIDEKERNIFEATITIINNEKIKGGFYKLSNGDYFDTLTDTIYFKNNIISVSFMKLGT